MTPPIDPPLEPCRFCASQAPNRMRLVPGMAISVCRVCLRLGHPDYSIVKDHHPANRTCRYGRTSPQHVIDIALERITA